MSLTTFFLCLAMAPILLSRAKLLTISTEGLVRNICVNYFEFGPAAQEMSLTDGASRLGGDV